MNKSLLFLICIIVCSCSTEYTESKLIKDILSNNSSSVIDEFYKPHRLDKESFKHVIQMYSKVLKERDDLNQVLFRDEVNFKKRPRLGYNFINANNNIEYSITYKFTELPNGRMKVNFIDFRSSLEDLPCLKFPSKFPVRCIDAPIELPKNIDSLKANFPIKIAGKNVYHEQLLSEHYVAANNDSLRQIVAFNLGNKKVGNNIEEIINAFSKDLNSEYTFSSWSSYGEPTTYLSFVKDQFDFEDILSMKSRLENILDEDVVLNEVQPTGFSRNVKPRIVIGGIVSQAKVRVCGLPGLTTLRYRDK